MKTLGSFAALAAAATSALLAVGCGCDPGNNSVRAPVEFTPASVTASRTPASCAETTYGANDTFGLELKGDGAAIQLVVASGAAAEQSVPLMVSADATASSNDGNVHFTYLSGGGALDASPLASVIVTPTAMPSADGETFSLELHLTFEDGRVLDQIYGAPISTTIGFCPKS